MTNKGLIKKITIGLCMAALFIASTNAGTAFAQSAGGTSPASAGAASAEDSLFYEKQREMDQFLFIDHADEIEKLGFKVIYTGIAENHIEVGITPYNDEFAAYIYDQFGTEWVKVVDTEEVVLYDTPVVDAPDAMPIEPDNVASPVMPIIDMGEDTPVSNSDDSVDEALLKEREQLMADEEEKLTIQIESIDGDEPRDAMDPELIWHTGVVEDIAADDIAEEASEDAKDISLEATDDVIKTTVADNVETKDKGLPTSSVIAIVVAGVIIIGGTAFASAKKKAGKKN